MQRSFIDTGTQFWQRTAFSLDQAWVHCERSHYRQVSIPVLQSLSHVWLFVTPWTTAWLPGPPLSPRVCSTLIYVHWVSDAIQPSHPLLPPSPPAFNLSQHQSLFQWVGSWHQVTKVLELQLQHPSFQWIFRFDFLRMTGLVSLLSEGQSKFKRWVFSAAGPASVEEIA